MSFKVPEKNRVTTGVMGSTIVDGNNGYFLFTRLHFKLRVICSDGAEWEHASVTRTDGKMPGWKDMCFVKEKFWGDDDVVMQLHPAKEEWISNHDKCLHLWRPINTEIPLPPSAMVGVKGMSANDISSMSIEQRVSLKNREDAKFLETTED